jgi:2-polyprenyl-3-methyl-5-hydroxy-6-metoxy-1,4-benzoquinol methylase
MTDNTTYQEQLSQEADLWGSEAQRMAGIVLPEWQYHRHLRHNVVMHGRNVDALLKHIEPGMKVLELGCASGWLTLAMAQQGANATGKDLSEKSLSVARAYYESIRDRVPGSVQYEESDLNHIVLLPDTYDVIVVKAVLHHLLRLDHVIAQIHNALKPGGLLWVSDTNGEEHLSTVLIAAGLTFVLPTQVGYREKIRGLLRFGLRAPSRVKASIEAEGLSPFEGAGREHDWLKLITEQFAIERRVDAPAFTGYVTAQIKAPDWIANPLLKLMYVVDHSLVRLNLLKNTGVIIYARK